MATVHQKDLHVLIIGAGITGLLIAQGLKKNSVPFTVLDSEPSSTHYRPREWGLSLTWGIPLLQSLLPKSLFDRLPAAQCDPHWRYDPSVADGVKIYHGGTGDLIKTMPQPERYCRVSRRAMRNLCAEGINVTYNKKVVSLAYPSDSTVQVICEDGTSFHGSNILGCDGGKSTIRRLLLGPELASSIPVPYTNVNIFFKYPSAEQALFVRQLHPVMAFALTPQGELTWISVQEVLDPEAPETWTFQLFNTFASSLPIDMNAPPAVVLEDLKRRAEHFAEPFKSAIMWVPDDHEYVVQNPLSYWTPVPWTEYGQGGRVTLAGDAAHNMTPHRGQGLQVCTKDSVEFVEGMVKIRDDEGNLEEVMGAYDKSVLERGKDEVKTSWMSTQMLHNWEMVKKSPLFEKEMKAGEVGKGEGR